ncbi:MAG: DUF402 domain-containing protein [Haloarculaceae archaeon]
MTGDDEPRDADATVKVRGIYATALTRLLSAADGANVVQASPPIRERFDAAFPEAPAAATVSTTDDRQGIGVTGRPSAVAAVVDRAREAGVDALAWRDPAPRGAVYAGEVTETLGGGAVVELTDATADGTGGNAASPGDADGGGNAGDPGDAGRGGTGIPGDAPDGDDSPLAALPVANVPAEGFLPYSKTATHVETGDRLRVQVREASGPWGDGRPVLDATVRVYGSLLSLVRGGAGGGDGDPGGGPELADLLPVDPPEGWAADWAPAAEGADLDALGAALESAGERARALDAAFEGAPPPADAAPGCYWPGEATAWVWFGREARFGLDERRRAVTDTMPGHHRVKAGTERASAAVDFVEALCPGLGGEGDDGTTDGTTDGSGGGSGAAPVDDAGFPFDVVTRQFGPAEGDSLRIEHGKPDGCAFSLGEGEVTRRDADGTVVVEREMSGRGTYDALGVEQRAGDVAVTKLTEGKWWYPTVYRGSDGETRGTYVNVCTPVEVFPRAARYVDLHVDVVKHADGRVERVDDDELDAAVAAGRVPEALAEKARRVASAVENAL